MRPKTISIVSLCLLLAFAGCGPDKDDIARQQRLDKAETLGQLPVDNLPAPTGGVVITVNGEPMTTDEIAKATPPNVRQLARTTTLAEFKAQAAPVVKRVIEQEITNTLLYKQAKNEMLRNNTDIDEILEKAKNEQLKKFLAGFDGDYAKAEVALKDKGMTWDDFLDYQDSK